MAIYHSRVKTFSRARGDSSIAAAAYRAGALLIDHMTGKRHDYRRRGGVAETACFVPSDAPEWATIPALLWPAAEAAEKRKNSTVAREFEMALPHELDDGQRTELVRAIAEALVDRYGFAIQASIHTPGSNDGLNHHVHLLATTRRLTPDGFGEKTRELDGGASGRVEIEWIRHTFAASINAHLAAAGFDDRVDHRSLAIQADEAWARGDWVEAMILSREPTKHVGKTASALERKGVATERRDHNSRIEQDNQELFDQVLEQAQSEGRVMPSSTGHGQEQARRDRQRPRGIEDRVFRAVPGLEIQGLRGMRLSEVFGDPRRKDAKARPEPTIRELISAASRELVEVIAIRSDLALSATKRLLKDWGDRAASLVDTASLRAGLVGLVARLETLKRRVLSFSRRLEGVRRAERLVHMAENAWEQFNGDCPRPAGELAADDWVRRRGRRLVALEKRTAELKNMREGVSPEVRKACEEAVQVAVGEVEHWSSVTEARWAEVPHPLSPLDEEAVPKQKPAPSARRRPPSP